MGPDKPDAMMVVQNDFPEKQQRESSGKFNVTERISLREDRKDTSSGLITVVERGDKRKLSIGVERVHCGSHVIPQTNNFR